MRTFVSLALAALFVLVQGCATQPAPRGGAGVDVRERITQQGYSLAPTDEPGWILMTRSAFQLALAREGRGDDETFAIQATLVPLKAFKTLDEFLAGVRAGQQADTDPKRFSVSTHEVVPYSLQGTQCARTHMVATDNAAVKRTNRRDDMRLEMATLICPHPENGRVGVSVVYSQRAYAGQATPGFMDKADAVIGSVRIEPLPQQ